MIALPMRIEVGESFIDLLPVAIIILGIVDTVRYIV
jgi:hypothetical protein